MTVFVCVRIGLGEEIIKPWFARSMADSPKMLKELYPEFCSGVFDGGNVYDSKSSDMTVKFGKPEQNIDVSVDSGEQLGDVVSRIGNFIEFVITPTTMEDTENVDADKKQHVLNLLSIMMNAQRSLRNLPSEYPVLKPNKKLDLKNDILKLLARNELGWQTDTCAEQGIKFVDNLSNVL